MSFFDRKTAQVLFTTLLFLGGLALLWGLRELLFLLVAALLFAYTVEPLVRWLQILAPRAISRKTAITVTYLLVTVISLMALAWLAQMVTTQAAALIGKLPDAARSSDHGNELPLPAILEPFRDDVTKFGLEIAQMGLRGLMSGLGSAGLALLIPIFALYILKDGPQLRLALEEWASGFAPRHQLEALLDDLHIMLSEYIRALLLMSANVFLVYTAFYQLTGVPYAMLLATIAAIAEVVPVAGWISAGLMSVLIAAFSGHDHWPWMIAFYLVFRAFQDYVVAPWLMSGGVALHPLMVIAGVIGGEMVAGVQGMFLSIPAMAAARVIWRHVAEAKKENDAALD